MPSITEVDNIKSLDDVGQTSILTKTGTGAGGDKVFTLDNVTLGSSVGFPAGHVIQHEFLKMTAEDDTSSTSFESTGFAKAITLSSASNQVLVFVTAAIHGPAGYYYFDVVGTTTGQLGHATNGLGRGFADSAPFSMWTSFTAVDTPGVAEQTYTLYHKVSAGTGYVNVSAIPGYIHLFELIPPS